MKKKLFLITALAFLIPSLCFADGFGNKSYKDGDTASVPGGTVSLGKNPSNVLKAVSLDSSGYLNVNVAAGSASNAAAGTTGSAVPASADYQGLNVGGTLRGGTGVNPSGSVYAQQVDIASVAGTTVATGSGTASGAVRVELPTNGTGTVGLNAGTNNVGFFVPTPGTTGGWSASLNNALSTTIRTVKGSAGTLGGYYCYNPNSSVSYIQIFDANGATLGSTSPKWSIGIPATSAANLEMTNGMNFATEITVAATTTATGSSAPSTACDCNFIYK